MTNEISVGGVGKAFGVSGSHSNTFTTYSTKATKEGKEIREYKSEFISNKSELEWSLKDDQVLVHYVLIDLYCFTVNGGKKQYARIPRSDVIIEPLVKADLAGLTNSHFYVDKHSFEIVSSRWTDLELDDIDALARKLTPKDINIDLLGGLSSIAISGGTAGGFGGQQLLSTPYDGRKVDLYSHNDCSGRQMWKLEKIPGTFNHYHIHVSTGTKHGEKLLSTTADGRKVDLYSHDDGSGRQQWKIGKIPNTNFYHILIVGGVSSGRKFLSTTSDGRKVDLWYRDDNSGRQKWKITKTSEFDVFEMVEKCVVSSLLGHLN